VLPDRAIQQKRGNRYDVYEYPAVANPLFKLTRSILGRSGGSLKAIRLNLGIVQKF